MDIKTKVTRNKRGRLINNSFANSLKNFHLLNSGGGSLIGTREALHKNQSITARAAEWTTPLEEKAKGMIEERGILI